jgi:hypothetical protein
MKSKVCTEAKVVSLPWSNGNMSAKLWSVGKKTIACVPELGIHCYGTSQSEVLFRLFTVLLKYHRQLNIHKARLGKRGQVHLDLLTNWMNGIEERMRLRNFDSDLVIAGKHTLN